MGGCTPSGSCTATSNSRVRPPYFLPLSSSDYPCKDILLTCDPLSGPLPPSSTPLIKLTDFGLARFIDPSAPLLQTRCGSESYAAPELVTGRRYDGRQTDAWACGVVLYALACRALPFDGPKKTEEQQQQAMGEGQESPARKRRKMLVRIANGEFEWPVDAIDPTEGEEGEFGMRCDDDGEARERRGMALARSPGVRRTVDRLLVRDPAHRAAVVDLWEDEWMWGPGAPVAPASASRQGSLRRGGSGASSAASAWKGRKRAVSALSRQSSVRSAAGSTEAVEDGDTPVQEGVDLLEGEEEEGDGGGEGDVEVEVEEHGILVDGDSIDDIARQELR